MIEFKKNILLENVKHKSVIRKIVKDIINVFKNENDGEFYLPEYFDEDLVEYEFPNFSLSVEIIIDENSEVDDFLLNANFYRDDNIIVVKIVYNPEVKNKILYDLVGDLNETMAHELRHLYQRDSGMFTFSDDEDEEEEEVGIEYYTRPEEIDAQVTGFKRLAYLRKEPFEKIAKQWFEKNKDIHQMNDQEVEQVLKILIIYNSRN